MSIEDVVLIATVRDEIRTSRQKKSPRDTAWIRSLIEAAQVRMVDHVASGDFTTDVTPVISENEAAEEEQPPMEPVTSKVNNFDSTKEVKVPRTVGMHGGDEHSVSLWV
jgi:hypothetical protein